MERIRRSPHVGLGGMNVDKRIYIRVPEQLLKDFDATCEANYTTKSEVLRRAMLDYVRQNQKEATGLTALRKLTIDCPNSTRFDSKHTFLWDIWIQVGRHLSTSYCARTPGSQEAITCRLSIGTTVAPTLQLRQN